MILAMSDAVLGVRLSQTSKGLTAIGQRLKLILFRAHTGTLM